MVLYDKNWNRKVSNGIVALNDFKVTITTMDKLNRGWVAVKSRFYIATL